MKMAQLFKYLTTGGVLVVGITMAGMANAQADQSPGTTASGVSAYSDQTADSSAPSSPDVVIRGGYNVGRAPAAQVPGCTGPVSFCNMYSGS
ncbi:hypothetical protein GNZ12_04315 [Paraburkholderia sp. 1N]|uniref:PXPV repeat-containing protein n=1 Tax=Paraburkholderia solitsugae TaxID=2675748 RepID=A0ABX2BK49_9BURK|nr:hypothetical protein [Paraburkholderia solitsugae]NPT40546.1 hypothetical protein [Paraburkholderia solitsugae]